METSILPDMIETIRLINRRVRELMTRMQAGEVGGTAAGFAPLVEAGNFYSLLEELTRAAAWLRHVPPHFMLDAEWAKEISDYRNRLECLQQALPAIHGRLLAERARLEGARSHLAAVTAWASISKETL